MTGDGWLVTGDWWLVIGDWWLAMGDGDGIPAHDIKEVDHDVDDADDAEAVWCGLLWWDER